MGDGSFSALPRGSLQWRRARWGTAVPRRLLIGVRETDKLWLAPWPAHKLHSDRNAVGGKSSWNHDRGKAGRGRKFTVEARLASLTDHARLTCERWVNKRVNAIVSHRL